MNKFWRPEPWKFLVIAIFLIAVYALFRADEVLDFHDSWSPSEREQITECYRQVCDDNSEENKMAARVFMDVHFPEGGSWLDEACCWVVLTGNVSDYPVHVLIEHIASSTRRMIEKTAETGNVKLMDQYQNSLLHLALEFGYHDLAQSLVGRGADVNLRSICIDGTPGDTPLSWTIFNRTFDGKEKVSMNKCREMVDFLLEHGADIKAPATRDLPVTIQALMNPRGTADKESEDLLCYLLEKGAPQSWKSPGGETIHLLSFTVTFQIRRVTRYLLNHGADPKSLTPELQKKLQEMSLPDR